MTCLMLIITEKKNRTIVIKLLIAACIPLELKRGHLTAHRNMPHVDFSEPSAIDMEAQVNVSHQLRGLLPDLVNKRMNKYMQQTTYVFLSQVRSLSNDF